MPKILDDIERLQQDHETKITSIERVMEAHAAEALDPLRVQAVLDKMSSHTARLDALISRYPL